ncbi:TIGR03571 family LLM class oxidoreductase [Nocardiopsis sp. EMB25]|uniref:TIGR03571 family LLM class oxidoreductase n=1 Tax=Nocardiopsis sp. EMB25 TaxID=2835867 RepID=UPI002284F170|nr:TIGR03571 family LLM class oxidoreductase [Nocardiopsis sp. EMB25]MCY9783907.1 TIGR03571 family LLM class oxidoreductase [Nocardiopsis sp. EMB25]
MRRPDTAENTGGALRLVAPGPGRTTLGLELPLDNDWSPAGELARRASGRLGGEPDMASHAERARLADRWGFSALWLRDVPVYSPDFGDAGQVFDPFPYLGYLAAATDRVALGTAAIALPLRAPAQVAKMAATVDRLSGGRLILGVASGDRPVEFPLFGVEHGDRARILREGVHTLRSLWEGHEIVEGSGLRVLPVPGGAGIPLVLAGRGGQSMEWIAEHMGGHFTYHRAPDAMLPVASSWHGAVREVHGEPSAFRPLLTTMLVDLLDDPRAPVAPIRFGARLGRDALLAYLAGLRESGVNHVAINLRPSRRPVEEVIEELGTHVLPEFPSPDPVACPSPRDRERAAGEGDPEVGYAR